MGYAHLSTQSPTSTEELHDRTVYAIADQIDRQTISLLSLAQALNDDTMSDIVCRLSEAAVAPFPDPARMREFATALSERLAALTFGDIARYEAWNSGIADLDAAIRYHGAKMQDHVTRLSRIV